MAMIMKRKNRAQGEIPTASMADIAFLLLIFFLVTTVFDEERGLRIVLPEPGEQVEVAQSDVLHLLVQLDGTVQVKRGASPQVQTAQASEVREIWSTEHARNPRLVAAVRTSPNAPYRFMIDVLDQLRAAKADRISLQVLE
jgi:biopolymer transport protein ExbD